MGGWMIVISAAAGVAAGARWYVKGAGVAGYRDTDREAIRRARAQLIHGGAYYPH